MQRLPTLIFADEHSLMPDLSNILAKLAPQLKAAGYEFYYDEMPSNLSLDTTKELIKENLLPNDQLKIIIRREINEFMAHLQRFDTLNDLVPGFLYSTATIYLTDKINKTKDKVESQFFITTAIMMHSCRQHVGENISIAVIQNLLTDFWNETINTLYKCGMARLELLNAVSAAEMQWRGIDDPSLFSPNSGLDTLQSLKKLNDLAENNMNIDSRNKIMATAYLQPLNTAFGMTGLAHIEGLQSLINSWIPSEIARANFDFIYIYREKIGAGHPSSIVKIWEDYRQHKIPLPLGLTLIDSIDKDDDEVVEIVMQHVREKISAFNKLPDELKVIPDISLMASIRRDIDVKVGHIYRLFSSSVSAIRDKVNNQIWENKF